MQHQEVFSHSIVPHLTIVVDRDEIKLVEQGATVQTKKKPTVKDFSSYLEGFFAGAEYQQSAIRELRGVAPRPAESTESESSPRRGRSSRAKQSGQKTPPQSVTARDESAPTLEQELSDGL